ncbi:MAG: hypothetical protein M3Q52_09530 [Pseudomonadota bacterium]|nr:hypothetical protein [Pseudomonadota bacterium]
MSEAALWLDYAVAAAIAFSLVYFRCWRIVPSMFAATLAALAIYLLVSVIRGGSLDDPFLEAALIINGSLSLIFAGVGAAAGSAYGQAGRKS